MTSLLLHKKFQIRLIVRSKLFFHKKAECSLVNEWRYLESGPCPFIPTKAAAAAKSSLFLSMMVVDRGPPEPWIPEPEAEEL